MILLIKFLPLIPKKGVDKTAKSLGQFEFEGSDLESIAKTIARKIQKLEADLNPEDPQSADRKMVGFTIIKARDTHIPPNYLELDIIDQIGIYLSRGEWTFWDPR